MCVDVRYWLRRSAVAREKILGIGAVHELPYGMKCHDAVYCLQKYCLLLCMCVYACEPLRPCVRASVRACALAPYIITPIATQNTKNKKTQESSTRSPAGTAPSWCGCCGGGARPGTSRRPTGSCSDTLSTRRPTTAAVMGPRLRRQRSDRGLRCGCHGTCF